MVLDNFGDREYKLSVLFAVPIQKGKFCFPTSLDSLLNNIFKEADVSRSLKWNFAEQSAWESRKWNREMFTYQTTCFELFILSY